MPDLLYKRKVFISRSAKEPAARAALVQRPVPFEGCRQLCQPLPWARGSISATPATPAAAPAPGAAMASGMATVLAKLDALIAAISKESGFLEKVLS